VDKEKLIQILQSPVRDQGELKARRRLLQFIPKRELGYNCAPRVTLEWKIIPESAWSNARDGTFTLSLMDFQGGAFFTSVDMIGVIECAFGAHLCTAEKNRVRRNFECKSPSTQHKGDSAFYPLLNSFVNPKPRNIDKSVKVFKVDHFVFLLEKVLNNYVRETLCQPQR
jgi:hypothetical protein